MLVVTTRSKELSQGWHRLPVPQQQQFQSYYIGNWVLWYKYPWRKEIIMISKKVFQSLAVLREGIYGDHRWVGFKVKVSNKLLIITVIFLWKTLYPDQRDIDGERGGLYQLKVLNGSPANVSLKIHKHVVFLQPKHPVGNQLHSFAKSHPTVKRTHLRLTLLQLWDTFPN